MSDSRRISGFTILIILLLLIMVLVIQGITVVKLYAYHHPESRLVDISERVEKLESAVGSKARKLERRITDRFISHSESSDSKGGKMNDADKDQLPLEDWSPFQEMRRMRDQVNEMFGHSLERFEGEPGFDGSWLETPYLPAVDFESKEDRYVVKMDVPGIDKSQLDVSLEGLLLKIKGQRDELIEKKEGGELILTERLHGQFLRSFTMPGGIDPEKSTAEYKDGVLTVTIPKGEVMSDVTHKIEVQ